MNNTLAEFQKLVGGYIEVVDTLDDGVILICNEEGKNMNLPLNRAIYNDHGEMSDIICGPFLVVGDGEDFKSLSNDMLEKYAKKYEKPERFFKLGGQIVSQKVKPPKTQDTKKHKHEQSR